MAASLITLTGAAFGYRGRPVVSGVDLEVAEGSFLGLVGSNGAGKTTLMRGVLGLLEPLQGRVERRTTAIGYVPQREALDPVFPLSVQEVVRMGAFGRLGRARQLRAEDSELVGRSLERVGLADRARLRFSSLSGGQRQRALIARALVMRPKVLLLDEPTSGVDVPTQRMIVDLLGELNRTEGLAVLLVSHQLEVTRTATRDVLLVCDGAVMPVDDAGGFAGHGQPGERQVAPRGDQGG